MILQSINVIKLFILQTKLKHLKSVMGTQNILFVVVVFLTFTESPFFLHQALAGKSIFCRFSSVFQQNLLHKEGHFTSFFNNLNMIIYRKCK